MIKSVSKNRIFSIKKYAKNVFPILSYTIFNRKYALEIKFIPVNQMGPKDLQLDAED